MSVESVVPFAAVVVGGHETGISENPEVTRDGRPTDVVLGGEVDDACTADGEPTQQVASNRVG